MIRRIVLFGATGDLSSRYLLPALAHLHEARRLPEGFALIGASREEWDTDRFRREAERDLDEHAAEVARDSRKAVLAGLEYRRADAADRDDVAAVLREVAEPVAVYLALPPQVYPRALQALAGARMEEGSRVVVEKPFGEDLASARGLNEILRRDFPEDRVFRMDHFLGLQTVQNVLGLRFANRVFEPLWSREHVESVTVVWDETLALEGRAGYYDRAGALRDMIQNHLLQVLCLVAMEPPASLDESDLRDRKLELLRTVRPPSLEDVERHTVRARYAAGRIGERRVKAYVDEEGVDPERRTETFARVTLFVANDRWSGVPFTLRTGKALGEDRHEIVLRFRRSPHATFAGEESEPNVLRLSMEPDGMSLGLNVNAAGEIFDLERVQLDVALAPPELPAYAQLLLDVLRGDPALFVRGDEAEAAWRIVDPIHRAWSEDKAPLLEYAAGSEGP
ncbi:MAG: glucose-6-phosphate dehydrogenase [Gemmatimonadota bacterium]